MDLGEDDTCVPASTPLELQLTKIFEELLDTRQVGIHDSFFDLSGFSLIATQLAARIYETFRVELTLRNVFQAPTIDGLARLITQAQADLADDADIAALLAEIE